MKKWADPSGTQVACSCPRIRPWAATSPGNPGRVRRQSAPVAASRLPASTTSKIENWTPSTTTSDIFELAFDSAKFAGFRAADHIDSIGHCDDADWPAWRGAAPQQLLGLAETWAPVMTDGTAIWVGRVPFVCQSFQLLETQSVRVVGLGREGAAVHTDHWKPCATEAVGNRIATIFTWNFSETARGKLRVTNLRPNKENTVSWWMPKG